MTNAHIDFDIGKGIYGGDCNGTPPENPVVVFGQPFGHGFLDNLLWLLDNCNNCSIYLPTTEFNVDSLSSQHEIINTYCRAYGGTELNDGDYCELHTIWKKNTTIIYYDIFYFYWDETKDYFHEFACIGWTPCWRWKYGSFYNGWEEIKDEGTDYSVTVEFYGDGYLLDYGTKPFKITNLRHTKAYWSHIKDFSDREIDNSLFGMEASSYVHDLGDDVNITATYKQKNLSHSDSMYIDGMENDVYLKIFHSGYVKQSKYCGDVTEKEENGPYDFTNSDYLRASVQGMVIDADGYPVKNAVVFATSYNPTKQYYGCKTNNDGIYALPLHKAGNYYINAHKNNFYLKQHSHDAIQQTSCHPESSTEIYFSGSNHINRVTDYPRGDYAHINTLAVDNQSVIIPDDPVTDGNLIKPNSVATNIVKVKTHKWGTGAAQSTTSTGTWDSSTGYGSGGFNYAGDTGDAEEWEEE